MIQQTRQRFASGIVGPPNQLTIGTVVAGVSAAAILTGDRGNQVLSFVLPKGDPGNAGNLAIGTVSTGAAAATITGVAPNQTLNLVLPPGVPGPANALAIGTVTAGPAAASITGTAPNQTLSLTLPPGAPSNVTIGTVTTLAAGASATATLTGTAPNYSLNLGLPVGATGASGRNPGLKYAWATSTSGDPGNGKVATNSPTFGSVTTLAISKTDAEANGLAALLATWSASTNTVRGALRIENPLAPANFMDLNVTGLVTDAGTYDTVPVTPIASGGAFAAGDVLAIRFARSGDRGADGSGSGNVNATGTVVTGHVAIFSDTTGKLIQDGGVAELQSNRNIAGGYAGLDGSARLPASAFPALTGDVTTTAGALATTLAATAVAAGSYGSATQVGTFTVDAKGRLTAASSVAITFPVTTVAGRTGAITLAVADVSGAAALASPTFTGTPAAPTAAAGTNTTQLATTAFVTGALVNYALLASPAFTGSPTAPTQTAGDNSTKLATTAFVATALAPASVTDIATGTDNTKPVTSLGLSNSAAELTVTYAATIALDLTARKDFVITLSGPLTLSNFPLMKPGDKGTVRLVQDATGGRTLAVGSYFKLFGGGTVDTAANAETILSFDVRTTTKILYTLVKA